MNSDPRQCPQEKRLPQLIADELPDDEAALVAEHIDTCAVCTEASQRLSQADEPLVALLRKPVPPELLEISAEEELQAVVSHLGTMIGDATRREVDASAADTDESTGLDPTQASAGQVARDADLPESFGRYHIIRRLGKGGMGAVYLAEDTELQRQVALKVPFTSSETSDLVLDRFRREARAAATLRHPNICPIFDVGEHDGVQYLTMAFIDGRSLSEELRAHQPLPVRRALEIVKRIALALQAAHEQGVTHRDLKPANVMIDERGEPVVMDFGLARRGDAGDQLTQTGHLVGTPSYMAPEQFKGDPGAVGPACDIYSLGVVLYVLLTGETPFSGDVLTIASKIALESPEPPSQRRGADS